MMRAVEAHSCRRHSPAGQCGAPFFCALDALAIDDRSARAGVPPRQLPACHIERVVHAPERAVVVPSVEVVVQGAARRQVLGDRGPLAARAQDVHEAVGHLAQVDRPLVAAALGGRDQRGNQRPFLVGQVTWVAQLATVVATAVLTRPHQRLPPNRNAAKEITTNSKDSRCSRMDTKGLSPNNRVRWNRIEHRLLAFITQNWRGKPLLTHQVIVQLIASTTTPRTGLTVQCRLDRSAYAKGIKVSDAEMATLNLRPAAFHGDWNYT